MCSITNNHDAVHVHWVAWAKNALVQEAVIPERETKVGMRKVIKKVTWTV
jgi:hypothetical protein